LQFFSCQPVSKNPSIDLKLRAPIELENLLPYDIQYRIYDKDAEQNWRSYLRRGGVMPVHSVELAHLVLLNVQAQDTGMSFDLQLLQTYLYHLVFKPSEFAIINTDAHSDFEVETKLTMTDARNRKLNLKLNYV
jgi:vacuolar protein sorting-associated protein 13A/C